MRKSSARDSRRATRAAKRRNRRLIIGLILLVVLALLGFGVYSALSRPETVITPTGLQYQDIVVGQGNQADPLDTVSVHYTGTLTNGEKFDSSLDRNQPFEFTIGVGDVIKGWDEGVAGMKEGGKRRLTIPPELGYGAQGSPPVIPPNATLVFEVELLEVK